MLPVMTDVDADPSHKLPMDVLSEKKSFETYFLSKHLSFAMPSSVSNSDRLEPEHSYFKENEMT